MITGAHFRPHLIVLTKDNTLFILELTVGYQTNLRNNTNRKHTKYKKLIEERKKIFPSVIFANLSISALGVFDEESAAFINMFESMHLDKSYVKYTIN